MVSWKLKAKKKKESNESGLKKIRKKISGEDKTLVFLVKLKRKFSVNNGVR